MTTFMVRRLLLLVPVMLGVTLVVFMTVRMLPGDAALFLAGEDPSPDTIERIRTELGLREPLYVQFWLYVQSLAEGDLGRSLRTHQPVVEELVPRILATAQLALAGLGLATAIGIAAGIVSATRPHSWFDNLSMTAALFFHSIPVFWSGLMLIYFFAVGLGWFPAGGNREAGSLVLPTLAIGIGGAGLIARMTRSTMLEVMRADYITTARAKGLRERTVVGSHALRNALIPVLTVISLSLGHFLGAAVVTETVFNWPGLGTLIVDSINSRDYTTLQAGVLVFAFFVAVVNLVADLLYGVLDPRIGYS